MVPPVRHVRYLWSHRWGRLAVLMLAVGILGLTAHYWTGVPLLLALRVEV